RPRRLARGLRRQPLAVSGLVLVAAAVAVVLLVSGGSRGASTIAADSVAAIRPSTGAISTVVRVGSSPSNVAAGDGSVWVSNYSNNPVSRINPTTHAVVPIPVDSTPSGIAVGDRAVWVANTFSGTVSRIDPKLDRVLVPPISVGNGPSGVAVGSGYVW